MKKIFLLVVLVAVGSTYFSGCAVRVTPLSEGAGWVETDTKDDTVTVTTKEKGVVTKEVTTTRKSSRKKTRPFQWQDQGYGGYGGGGYYR